MYIIRWPSHIVHFVMVLSPLIVHDLSTLTFVPEIIAQRREVTLRFFLHWKIEELIHPREHVIGISQQSLSGFASLHIEVHKPKRLAGFVEPVFLHIITLNELFQGDGSERRAVRTLSGKGGEEATRLGALEAGILLVAILDLLASHLLDGKLWSRKDWSASFKM